MTADRGLLKKSKTMIVKVQSSLSSSDGVDRCLIYDRSRKIFYETGKDDEIKSLKEKLKGKHKAYFFADFDKDGKITIKEEAPNQNW